MLPPWQMDNPQAHAQQHIAQQQTIAYQAVPHSLNPTGPPNPIAPSSKRTVSRIIALLLVLALAIAFYFIWHPTTSAAPSTGVSQQNFGNGPASTTSKHTATNTSTANGSIQVYVVGAVKHPGVYGLPSDARVYQLVLAAGGPLPNANLVALNLAARLNDGQEVYVTAIGEVPPTYMGGVPGLGTTGNTTATGTGQLVNINTASADEMRQSLHVSSTTAQNIVNYRTQNGPFTSIDQLTQVVSKSIYDKIKGQVTV